MKNNYEHKEGEFQMGSIESVEIDNYNICFEKIERAEQLKKQHEEQICLTNIEYILQQIKIRLVI